MAQEDARDRRTVTLYDDEALELMQGWWGSQGDPLYAIYSMGGQHEASVFQDAIDNLDYEIGRVKKIGRGKFQLGKGTFSKKEIDELHTIRNALEMALSDAGSALYEARRPRQRAAKPRGADRLFIGIFPGGIVYADRSREMHGDYARCAFLDYDTLTLRFERDCPADLKAQIEQHARATQARRGSVFPTSSSGQSVILGGARGRAMRAPRRTPRVSESRCPSGSRPYMIRYVHKISPSDKDVKGPICINDNAFSNRKTLGAALRKAGIMFSGAQVRNFRAEGGRTVVFPNTPGHWHSIILTPE